MERDYVCMHACSHTHIYTHLFVCACVCVCLSVAYIGVYMHAHKHCVCVLAHKHCIGYVSGCVCRCITSQIAATSREQPERNRESDQQIGVCDNEVTSIPCVNKGHQKTMNRVTKWPNTKHTNYLRDEK